MFNVEKFFSQNAYYDVYVTDAKEYAATQAQALDSDIASLTKQIGNKKEEYDLTKAIIREKPALAKHYDLDEIEAELTAITTDHDMLVKRREGLKQSILTYSEYLELFGNIGVTLAETHDMAVLDENIKKFFLNFTVKQWGLGKQQRSEVTFNLNEPFAGFIKTGSFDNGRGDRT